MGKARMAVITKAMRPVDPFLVNVKIVRNYIIHVQLLFENCRKANCNQKAKSNESEHNPHTL